MVVKDIAYWKNRHGSIVWRIDEQTNTLNQMKRYAQECLDEIKLLDAGI